MRTADTNLRQHKRAEQRQEQVLDAARACVRAEGFHAASISRIAAKAGMSAGHIYHYFTNKEEIVIALCERDFDDFMRPLNDLDRSSDLEVLIETLLGKVSWLLDSDRATIALEIMAEAARNPKVAALVARIDCQFRDTIRRTFQPLLANFTQGEADLRVDMLLLMIRSVPLHGGSHPLTDPDAFREGLALAIRGLFSNR